MEAELIGIGPCNDRSKTHLAYPAEDYGNVKPGTKVYSLVAYCETSQQSRDLADLLELHPGKLEEHHINRKRAMALAEKFQNMPWPERERWERDWRPDAMAVMEQFVELARAGFEFFYLPNC